MGHGLLLSEIALPPRGTCAQIPGSVAHVALPSSHPQFLSSGPTLFDSAGLAHQIFEIPSSFLKWIFQDACAPTFRHRAQAIVCFTVLVFPDKSCSCDSISGASGCSWSFLGRLRLLSALPLGSRLAYSPSEDFGDSVHPVLSSASILHSGVWRKYADLARWLG